MEVCVDSVESAFNAVQGGCVRLEVCSALRLGGLTPSMGLLSTLSSHLVNSTDVHVLIRPNDSWTFHYTSLEVEAMRRDIVAMATHVPRVKGFVVGLLDSESNIDVEANEELVRVAKELRPDIKCTFHRAFDVLNHPEQAVQVLSDLGFDLVLTSGQSKDAHEGREMIKRLVKLTSELKVDVMAGGGLTESNLESVLRFTSVKHFHGSAKTVRESKESKLGMENQVYVTSTSKVAAMMDIYKRVMATESH